MLGENKAVGVLHDTVHVEGLTKLAAALHLRKVALSILTEPIQVYLEYLRQSLHPKELFGVLLAVRIACVVLIITDQIFCLEDVLDCGFDRLGLLQGHLQD